MSYSLEGVQEELSSEIVTDVKVIGIERWVRLAIDELNTKIEKLHLKILKTGRHYEESLRFTLDYRAGWRPGEIFLEERG